MPYRRLPNTDAARLRALRTAVEKGKEIPPFKLAFSQITLNKVQSFLPGFEHALYESKQAYSNQISKSRDYTTVFKKARLYISHFIQVVNMAVYRGELSENEKHYFGIPEESNKLPPLNSESDIIKWGEKIIHGADMRRAQSLSPITNPTAAVVKVRYEKFLEAYKFQKMLHKNFARAQERLTGQRIQADEIITAIWNEVEESFGDLTDNEKRDKAEKYGVTYVFRKNEKKDRPS